jgi:RNA recognition motif-containing protein
VYRELSEAEIQTVFEAFGPIRSCKFIPNPENGVGKHKGFGFIEYVDPAAASSAVQAMNGFTLAVPAPSAPCDFQLDAPHTHRHLLFASPLHFHNSHAGPRRESGMGALGVAVIEQQRGLAPSRCNVRRTSHQIVSIFYRTFPALHNNNLTLFCRAAAAAAALVNKQNGL